MTRPYRILILGFPRSGTHFLRDCLVNMNLDVGHEHMRPDGGIGYTFAKKNLPNDGPYKTGVYWRPRFKDVDVVCHVVRDPRCAIPSARANLPVGHEGWKNFDLAWAQWNLQCEQLARRSRYHGCTGFRFAIESVEPAIRAIADQLNMSPPEVIDGDRHHRNDYEPLKWNELCALTKATAKRYGYRAEGVAT